MRGGQRNTRPLQQMVRHALPQVRIEAVDEKIVRIRFQRRGRSARRGRLQRQSALLRDVRHGAPALTLNRRRS